MSDFKKWKERYQKRWCTKAQLIALVDLKVLTAIEFEEITGEKYAA